MRPWTEVVYGIPPEQVVGSSIKTKFEIRDGNPVIVTPTLVDSTKVSTKQGRMAGLW